MKWELCICNLFLHVSSMTEDIALDFSVPCIDTFPFGLSEFEFDLLLLASWRNITWLYTIPYRVPAITHFLPLMKISPIHSFQLKFYNVLYPGLPWVSNASLIREGSFSLFFLLFFSYDLFPTFLEQAWDCYRKPPLLSQLRISWERKLGVLGAVRKPDIQYCVLQI